MPADVTPRSAWLPPDVYDDQAFRSKYLVDRELGVGGAGIVVGARHVALDERVAIKFLRPGPHSGDAAARFLREARAAARIKNEHVVRIFDVSTTKSGVPYIVMEYLDGVDLERMLHQSPHGQLPVRDAVEFVLQACEALAECHGMGIVHRDLKPSNLFCVHGADGLPIVKVLDFGISKLGSVTKDQFRTGQHTIMGSPRYMSPEQFDSTTDVDQRSDIWSLGVILYELITGTAPFVEDTFLRIWRKVETQAPRPIEELRRDAPVQLNPVVAKCLEKAPADRYENVAELAKALLPFASERAYLSVERIVRIVESPSASSGSLTLRSVRGDEAPERAALELYPPDSPTLRDTRLPVRLLVPALLALAVLAALGGWFGRPDTPLLRSVVQRPLLPVERLLPERPRAPPSIETVSLQKPARARTLPAAPPRVAPDPPRIHATKSASAATSASPPPVTSALPETEPAPEAPVLAPEGSAAPEQTASAEPPAPASPQPSGTRFLIDIVEQRRPPGRSDQR